VTKLALFVQVRLCEVLLVSKPVNFFRNTGTGDGNGCLFGEDADLRRILLAHRVGRNCEIRGSIQVLTPINRPSRMVPIETRTVL
jgi:hypothetical protein